ncbi:hypothetical protein [Tenacibaculum soleae]|uniref:hypothetical protein n=1 Tax=Tenacibaculum soleae TaxID=447689 RepID=UPI0026E1F925|nr:hypothetical protein [Tenacibaculum soleae]MDO6813798.1 hypothetical protein [Tenacibaculum soleae]
MGKVTGYNLDAVSEEESNNIVARLLKMIKEKDALFTCISDHIISEMILQDFIEIDLNNETIEGTTLTKKGWKTLYDSGVL